MTQPSDIEQRDPKSVLAALSGEPSRFMVVAGLQLETVEADLVTGTIELSADHHQPFGIVHGGVYCAAIESAASVGAAVFALGLGLTAVGVNNNTNFVRPLSEGRVRLTACPLQQGRTQQLWDVRLVDDRDRLIATGQVRLAHVPLPADRPGPVG